jgi:uncharacterized protein involved in response to NO
VCCWVKHLYFKRGQKRLCNGNLIICILHIVTATATTTTTTTAAAAAAAAVAAAITVITWRKKNLFEEILTRNLL